MAHCCCCCCERKKREKKWKKTEYSLLSPLTTIKFILVVDKRRNRPFAQRQQFYFFFTPFNVGSKPNGLHLLLLCSPFFNLTLWRSWSRDCVCVFLFIFFCCCWAFHSIDMNSEHRWNKNECANEQIQTNINNKKYSFNRNDKAAFSFHPLSLSFNIFVIFGHTLWQIKGREKKNFFFK